LLAPQAPGGDIRRLGYAPIRRGARSRLRHCVPLAASPKGRPRYLPPTAAWAAARPNGRRALLVRKPKAADAAAGDW